ncbi:hypothetical protein ACFFIY_03080 [Bhargavaea ullalensis]|uniref:Uncharacterized protein n=1 Tax=Bhargavaea ullalensis TaxID=1265685 RepID=A0ABV2GDK9_9BACL
MQRTMSYSDFLKELDKEKNYLSGKGTAYRQQTVVMAKELANQQNEIDRFLNRDELYRNVKSAFPYADKERVQDVTKMLSVAAGNIRLRAAISDEAAEYIQLKKINRRQKPLALIKNSNNR